MPICPTCQSSISEPIDQPTPQQTPSIPPAYDLPSLLSAVKQLTLGYELLSGRLLGNKQTKNNTSPKKPKLGRYVEQKQGRVTQDVKVFSKQDPETFVTFKQINALQFKDSVTGETWTWQR